VKAVPADTNSRTFRLISPSTVSIADFTGTNRSICLFDHDSTNRSATDDAAIPTPHAPILTVLRINNGTMLVRLDTVRQSVVTSSLPLLESTLQIDVREQREATRLTLPVSVGIWIGRLQNFV
jgi:hypothetical protein